MDPRVTEKLEEMEGTEGTAAFLDMMQDIKTAYVDPDSHPLVRVFHAVKSVLFSRYWLQFLKDNSIDTKKHFITLNTRDCMELNLSFLLKAVRDRESQNIYQQNSQCNEAHFRKLRSYTPTESTIVNVDAKGYRERLHKMMFEEKIMHDLPDLSFPLIEKRSKKKQSSSYEYTDGDIQEAVSKGVDAAKDKARKLGMSNFHIDLNKHLRPPKSSTSSKSATSQSSTQLVNEIDDDNGNDDDDYQAPKNHFGINEQNFDQEMHDEDFDEEEISQELLNAIKIGKITFLDEVCGKKFNRFDMERSFKNSRQMLCYIN